MPDREWTRGQAVERAFRSSPATAKRARGKGAWAVHVPIWRVVVGAVMILNGLLFLGQVYLFPDAAAALRVHRDLAQDADFQFIALKVLSWGLAGLAWVVAGLGLATGRRDWLPAAFVGFLLVDGTFAAQFWLWGREMPTVWISFGVFGLLSFLYAAVARHVWRETAGLA